MKKAEPVMGSAAEGKRALRRQMRSLVSGMEGSDFIREGRDAADAVLGTEQWEAARSVCCFVSMDGEISTDYLLRAALAAGKVVALPVVAGEDLQFHRVGTLDLAWDRGSFGIREPPSTCPEVQGGDLDGPVLVVLPGVAFDAGGGRLGHGKGFYDRFLRTLRSSRSDSFAVGFCLECQIVGSVPMADHDERLDAVASRVGMIRIGGK